MNLIDRLIETPEQERERLADFEEGSLYHELSKLPVTIEGRPEGLVIELPRQVTEHRLVVVPIAYDRGVTQDDTTPRQRHAGWWDCVVVGGDHPSYPVGGYRLSISAAELARGTQLHI